MKKYKQYAVYVNGKRKEILENYDVAVTVFKLFCSKYLSAVSIVLAEGEEISPNRIRYHETKTLLHRRAQRNKGK